MLVRNSYVPGLLSEVQELKARVVWLEQLATSLDPSLGDLSSVATGSAVPASRPASATSSPPRQPPPPPSIGLHLLGAGAELERSGSRPRSSADGSWSKVAMRILGLTGPPAGPSASLYAASLGEDTSEGHSEEELLEETETTAEAAALPPDRKSVV